MQAPVRVATSRSVSTPHFSCRGMGTRGKHVLHLQEARTCCLASLHVLAGYSRAARNPTTG